MNQLVVCVDNSGSMSGDKIRISKSLLNGVKKALNCSTKYYAFEGDAYKVTEYQFNQLSGNGGTNIQNTLSSMFNNYLRTHSNGGKTKFIFVTDAEDSIKDTNGLINAKNNCIKSYGNELYLDCVLVGSGGSCGNELKRVFGSENFRQCSNNQFQSVLNKICGGITETNKMFPFKGNMQAQINVFKNSNDRETQELGQSLQSITNGVSIHKNTLAQGSQKLNETKINLQRLEADKPAVISRAQNASSRPDIRRAEDEVNNTITNYRNQNMELNRAGEKFVQTKEGLLAESNKAEEMANKLKNSGNEISQNAEKIVRQIITCITKLDKITDGAQREVRELKKGFKDQLNELMNVVNKNNRLVAQFQQVQQTIDSSFRVLRDDS
eukprot:890747_1